MQIADFLPHWNDHNDGVGAVCIAGGGEPLINPHTGKFIDRLVENGVEVGVVTNGTLIDKFIEPLSKCTWVGVSVDAGNPQTYDKYKRGKSLQASFKPVIENISKLVQYSKDHCTQLGLDRPAYGVSFKYLLYKDNMKEVLDAAKIAKQIGCKNIHFRPAGTPWDQINEDPNAIKFDPVMVTVFNNQIEVAIEELDSPEFGVYGVTHKFDSQFKRANYFDKCYAIFMTAVFEPPSDTKEGFTLGLCCDRRGDPKLELIHNCQDVMEIKLAWGSKAHWQMHDDIIVSKCPRCTYQPHNQIYEQVILKDSMTHKFI